MSELVVPRSIPTISFVHPATLYSPDGAFARKRSARLFVRPNGLHAPNECDDDDDDREDDENVDGAAENMESEPADQPENEENNRNCPEHTQ